MIIILIALLSFIVGFWCGIVKETPVRAKNRMRFELQEDLKREYENFLSYDGTEQN